jgi:tetratricopeptide (TPR) repeat protein
VACCNIGIAYHRLDAYENAIASYQQAVNLQFNNANARDDLTLSFMALRVRHAALGQIKMLSPLDPLRARAFSEELD